MYTMIKEFFNERIKTYLEIFDIQLFECSLREIATTTFFCNREILDIPKLCYGNKKQVIKFADHAMAR